MSLREQVRVGRGPLWSALRSARRRALVAHIPIAGPVKPIARGAYQIHSGARRVIIGLARLVWFEPLFRGQCEHVGRRFQMELLPYLISPGRIRIGDEVVLSGRSTMLFGRRRPDGLLPELSIGDGSFIGHGCLFAVNESVRIGRHVRLATQVSIRDHDGHPLEATRRRSNEPSPPDQVAAVTIGDDVWIGAGALVLKGVTIGDRAVVAAASVVTADVAPDTVVAGNPARTVRSLA